MEIKVDEEELKNMTTTMGKDADSLDEAIQAITQQLEILRGIWEGQDADKFFDNAREYFEKMQGIPNCMRNMEKFANRANSDFNTSDESFSKELDTEVDEKYLEEYLNENGGAA